MSNALLGPGEAFDCSCAIRPLPENAEIAFAVRLKRDPVSIVRPYRKTIGASECELARRSGTNEVLYPDVGVFTAVINAEGNASAVRRNPGISVCLRLDFQRFDHFLFSVQQGKASHWICCGNRSRKKDQRSGTRNTELRPTSGIRAANAFHDRNL